MLNDALDDCINSKLAPCSPNNIPNSTDTNDAVVITYTAKDGWTTPAKCGWNCNIDYEKNENSCINTKLVPCDTNNNNPANSTDIIKNVTVTYTTADGWSAPAKCEWVCNKNYKKSGNSCIVACGDGIKDPDEDCDSGSSNANKEYDFNPTCNKNCKWNSYCGDGVVDNAKNKLSGERVNLYFDEGSGEYAIDSSGNGCNGSIYGASWVSGKHGLALSFNGTENSYVLTSCTPPTNNFTLMAWVKTSKEHEIDPQTDDSTDGTTGQKYIFEATHRNDDGGAGVSVGTNGVSVYEHGSGYMPALAVYNGSIGTDWVHITVVYSNRTPSIYINGNHVVTGLQSPKTTVFAPTKIGGGVYGYFEGQMDGVRIIDRAISSEEIKSAMSEACDDGSLNGTSGKCKTDCSGYDCVPATFTFEHTGAQQTWTAPAAGTYQIEVWGGQGHKSGSGVTAGGLGGYSKGTVNINSGETLYIFVGGGGSVTHLGGFNGGGNGGMGSTSNSNGGGGGGASDVRKGGSALTNRIIVAGGGGGGGGTRTKSNSPGSGGGGGGGYYGGGGGGSYTGNGGSGGTQSSGGSGGTSSLGAAGTNGTPGSGGVGGSNNSAGQGDTNHGGSGGNAGGTTGSIGVSGTDWSGGGGGGGGSGYIGGVIGGSMQNGINSGNGKVIITRICP